MIDAIEAAVVVGSSGLLAARPTAGKGRAFFYATDNSTIYYDTGSAWRELTTVGGVAASGVLIGGASSEGASLNAARADHVHALPLATTSANGAMAAADKVLLAGATSAPTANTLVKNDANGRFQVAAPSAAADVSTKLYVDQQVATRAPSSHTHTWAQITGTPSTYAPSAHTHAWAQITGVPGTYAPDAHGHTAAEITSGIFSTARLPVSTQSAPGTMSAADKLKLDRASSSSAASTLMMTDAAGRYQSAAPYAAADVANKAYVDAQVATAAPLAHNHSGSNITSGTISPLRIANVTAALDGLMSKADKADLDAATYLNEPGAIVRRGASTGVIYVPANTAADSATPKSYVDAEIATRALSSHTHTWAQVTGKPSTFAPSSHAHSWDEVTGKPSTFAPSNHSHSWSSITSKPSTFPASSHTHTAIANGGGIFYVASDGAVVSEAVYDRTYSGEPNLYITSSGTIGRSTVAMARESHNHSASNITSGTFAYERIRGTDQVQARTATNRSVWVDADGRFGQNTSSIRFKENVRDAGLDPAAVLRLRPRVYDRKNREEGVNEFGLIAEEVEAAVPALALYDRDGVLETVAYEKLAVAQQVVLQDLDRRLTAAGL